MAYGMCILRNQCMLLLVFSLSSLLLVTYPDLTLFLYPQIKEGFAEGKDLVVSVMCAMGEEQICALKDIGPK